MGPNVENVERRSQATPFAEDFLKELQGLISQGAGAQTVGPKQAGGVGQGNAAGLAQRVGGSDTASGVADFSEQLIAAVEAKSKSNTAESAAGLREEQSLLGNRFGSSLMRGRARLESDANLNFEQLMAQIMTDQGARETQAEQFDITSNLNALLPLFGIAQSGVLAPETVVSPGLGSQLLSAGAQTGAAFLTGGGSLPFFGGGGQAPNLSPLSERIPARGRFPSPSPVAQFDPRLLALNLSGRN